MCRAANRDRSKECGKGFSGDARLILAARIPKRSCDMAGNGKHLRDILGPAYCLPNRYGSERKTVIFSNQHYARRGVDEKPFRARKFSHRRYPQRSDGHPGFGYGVPDA